jgi:hypothetical protein
LRALARGQGNMGRRFYTRIETGLTSPAYMSATCTISCGFYKAHRTEKPVLVTLTVDRTADPRYVVIWCSYTPSE